MQPPLLPLRPCSVPVSLSFPRTALHGICTPPQTVELLPATFSIYLLVLIIRSTQVARSLAEVHMNDWERRVLPDDAGPLRLLAAQLLGGRRRLPGLRGCDVSFELLVSRFRGRYQILLDFGGHLLAFGRLGRLQCGRRRRSRVPVDLPLPSKLCHGTRISVEGAHDHTLDANKETLDVASVQLASDVLQN